MIVVLTLLPSIKKSLDVVLLERVVVLIDLDAELDLLDLDLLLVLLRFVSALVLLVQVLPVVHDPAHWRVRFRDDLHQIQLTFSSHPERILGLYDADLLSVLVNQPNFASTDSLVYPGSPIDTPPPG